MPTRKRLAAEPRGKPLEESLAQGDFHEIEEQSENQPVRPQRLALAHHCAFIVEQLLNNKGAMVRERQALWPYWLVLALLLNFVEVALRKGFFERLATWLRRQSFPLWHRQPA